MILNYSRLRKGRYVEDHLILNYEFIYSEFELVHHVYIFLDFNKAFDVVSQVFLARKLQAFL